MSSTWLVSCLLLQGAHSFMIYSSVYSLCLQDVPSNHTPLLRVCDLNSELQQWLWKDGNMLVNDGTKRCLSTRQVSPVLTVLCDGDDGLRWQCHSSRLTSRDGSLELSSDGRGVFLANGNRLSRWRSIEEGDICKEHLRLRRSSHGSQVGDDKAEQDRILDQREYLRWYYRTEDASSWKYAMLALSSGSLFIGSVLLVTSVMGNRTRKKIAMYKAKALTEKEMELQRLTAKREALVPAPLDFQPIRRGGDTAVHTHMEFAVRNTAENGSSPCSGLQDDA